MRGRSVGAASAADEGDPTETGQERQGVQVLARAGEILRLLKVSPGGLSQAEISASLGLARTTIHRLLNALAQEGLVQQSGIGARYRLGAEILQMADAARTSLVSEAHPILRALSSELDETVDLSILDRRQVTFVDQVVAPHRLRAVSAVGGSFPLHCTANGKAILACLPAAEARRLAGEELEILTANTVRTASQLFAALEIIRRDGVAFDLEEHSPGICAVGVSIGFTPLGYGAISVPMPVQRFAEKRDAAVDATKRIAREIRAILAPKDGPLV